LDRLNSKLSTNRVHQDLSFVSVGVQQPDLDQTVGIQGPVDFGQHRLCQTGSADHDHGLERVGFGTKCLTLHRC
jgi:hypothetical protein